MSKLKPVVLNPSVIAFVLLLLIHLVLLPITIIAARYVMSINPEFARSESFLVVVFLSVAGTALGIPYVYIAAKDDEKEEEKAKSGSMEQ